MIVIFAPPETYKIVPYERVTFEGEPTNLELTL